MNREPHYFSMIDFIKALFGSFAVGFTFLFNTAVLGYASKMEIFNTILVLAFTCIVVTVEIYALSYRYVMHKDLRPFSEFWTKRFFAITISSFLIVYIIVYIYGLNAYMAPLEIFKLASAIFMPAAIAGAAVEMLKK